MQTELPFWLQGLIIVGRDDDENEDKDDQDNDDDNDEEDEGDNEDDDKDGSSDSDEDDELTKKVDALSEALKKERRLRRQAEREARKAGKKKADAQDQQDAAEAQKALQAAEEKTRRLADGLRRREIDNAILEAARSEGFIDPTDALTDDIRKAVDVDQDDEDPTDIDIDLDSVTDAVKKLANKKKHLVGKALPNEPSGGKFRRKGEKKTDEKALEDLYPSLR